ncbi:hypothetical protein DFH27DRAFT_370806 [Peziza echinospora]|nr:hypothetical protein DFH27DRAFT_370806 [Peziza echinospora]
MLPPQALSTTYPTRLNTFNTGLITPIITQPSLALVAGTPGSTRTTKRGTQIINYAEAEEDDDIYEDRVDRGGSSIQQNPSQGGSTQQSALSQALGYDLSTDGIQRPVYVLPGKDPRRPPIPPSLLHRTETQLYQASLLPEHLVPIKLDIDIDSSRRLKDTFLWNINETLITPDQFALTMCLDLELPPHPFSAQIAANIRQQVEEYAPVAAMPLPPETEFRTIIKLEIYLRKYLYQDKFEWDIASLSTTGNNPKLTPESFARTICVDLGLTGEFLPAIASAIYEASLTHKKNIIEAGGLPSTALENDAAFSAEAGWRIDQESLGAGWAPHIHILSREDLEKREGDRERQIRRLRRETARFGMGNVFGDFMDTPDAGREGRGERKKRKRNRSLSPIGGSRSTPMQHGGSSIGAGSGGPGGMADWERTNWRCAWCLVPGTSTWAIKDGPFGPKSLCHACGGIFQQQGILPDWMRELHAVKGTAAQQQVQH